MKNSILFILLLTIFFISSTNAITCIKKHKVYGGETCSSIAKAGKISLSNFYKWNPGLKKSKCTTLHVGQYVCLSAPMTTSTTITTTINTTATTTATATTTTTTTTTSATPTPTYLPGLTVAVQNEAEFCLFLPSSPGNKANHGGIIDPDAIADSEKDAKPFCTIAGLTPSAKQLPDGFITSAHYQFNTTAQFVQVTGEINRAKYSLSSKDGGGQYDNHGAGSPPLSMCMGYKYYVSLIEPDIQGFCIRCCQSYQDCNASRSAYGCKRVVPPLPFSV